MANEGRVTHPARSNNAMLCGAGPWTHAAHRTVQIAGSRGGEPMNAANASRDRTAQTRACGALRHINETLENRLDQRTIGSRTMNEKRRNEIDGRQPTDIQLPQFQTELFQTARVSEAGKFAAALTHELTQPLAAAANFINSARRILAAGRTDQFGGAIGDLDDAALQVLQAGRIIRAMLGLMMRGAAEQRPENVSEMIEEARSLALAGVQDPDLEFRIQRDPDGAKVFADRIQIEEVLVNLIRNAIEAMADCREKRVLALTTRMVDESMIEIAVADSGPGIANDVADRIFEPFFSTRRNGMGLGLSICRSIIETHGGHIQVGSNPGGGTVFRFALAAARWDETANAA
jgi:two-component system sensor kinase FixL